MALKGIRVGSGFVGTHSGAYFSVLLNSSHHLLNVLGHVDGAEPGKYIQVVLVEGNAIVSKATLAKVIPVTPQYSVIIGYADGSFDSWQSFYFFFVEAFGFAQQVDFSQALSFALNFMNPHRYTGQIFEKMHGLAIRLAVCGGIRVEYG
jgi:hypothetical protein